MTHPVLQGMVSTGCQNQQAIFLAFHTYMELSEVEVLWNIDYHYSKDLDLIYISASDKPNSEKDNLYLPISSSKIITPEWILQIQKEMKEKHKNSVFTFVIKDQDSTSVHHKISPGLVQPLSPDAAKQKRQIDEKRSLFELELRRRKPELLTVAKEKLLFDSASEQIDCDQNSCEEVPIVLTIDEDGDSNQSKHVEVIEL